MNSLGCILIGVVVACVMAFFFVTAIWVVVGTIILLSKLVVWMAYLGGAFVAIGLIAWLAANITAK